MDKRLKIILAFLLITISVVSSVFTYNYYTSLRNKPTEDDPKGHPLFCNYMNIIRTEILV